jgi:hypothetical protein
VDIDMTLSDAALTFFGIPDQGLGILVEHGFGAFVQARQIDVIWAKTRHTHAKTKARLKNCNLTSDL